MKINSLLLFALPVALADWQFKSRPDLSPPRLNITIKATEEVEDGYLFLAPFSGFPDVGNSHGPRQAAPYIFTNDGDLVWSGFSYFSIWATNFQKGRVNGSDVLFSFEGSHNPGYGHGHGHITFLDQNYETIKELRAGNHRILDKHEFHIVNETSGLIQIYHPTPRDLSDFGAKPDQQWIVDSKFQELDIETGKVLFEWSSLDHVSPNESVLSVSEGHAGAGYNSSDAWDYFHINSVDKDEAGDYLLSARNAAALYKIDGTTGEVIWKLGGLPGVSSTDFESGRNLTFSFQHHARFIEVNKDSAVISFYDNSAQGSEDKNGKVVSYSPYSSGKIIEVNTKTWEAKLLFNAIPPLGYNLLSKSQGSTQVLPSGNVLVGWGSEGALTEYNSKAEAIFHAFVDSGDLGVAAENYRAFKFNWVGIPNESIAVYSEFSRGRDTSVYVSWNGDTETKLWKFFTKDAAGQETFIGKADKDGFETKLTIEGEQIKRVFAKSYDINGKELGSSELVDTIEEFIPYSENNIQFGRKELFGQNFFSSLFSYF
ncbi:hypothetical protein CAAN1_10S00166 [[Candida] anglica]|uniref:Arylsulfotransferase n=1 Tax=[Candida] anglica TaxID=148631 RepID=A0ABP0EII6_9ASCO